MKTRPILLAAAAAVLGTSSAQAAPVITAVGVDLSKGAYSFDFLGSVFTFSATGSSSNPLAVQNQAGNASGSSGGFLGVPLTPTSSFINRGTVTFDPGNNYATFTSPTSVPFSLGNKFVALRTTVDGQNDFGFAYTTGAVLNSYGFENIAGRAITATTIVPSAAVPEVGTWAMMIVGLGVVGGTMRRRRKTSTTISFGR